MKGFTQETRDAVTKASEEIAKVLLGMETWRTHWRVEVDGCVFKIDVKGYAKHGTERWKREQAYNAELLAEYEATEAERLANQPTA